MSFWVQHGYGKGTKIDELIQSGPLGGVVLSPADEDGPSLATTAAHLHSNSTAVLVDPQTYVWSIPDGVARNHGDHGLAFPGLHWSASGSDVGEIVGRVIDLNQRLGTDLVIAPTCVQRSLADVWTPLAIQFARTTMSMTEPDRVLVSAVLDEASLDDWGGVEDWLDVVTSLDVGGFYLIVARGAQTYPQAWEPARYGNLLRLVYRLGSLNDYRVLLGYTDVDGLGALAAGATGMASGWYYSLRAFSESKWQPSTGGRAARPRVLLPRLMVPLFAEAEAGAIARSSLSDEAVADDALRTRLASQSSQWSLNDAWSQHLQVLQQLSAEIDALPDTSSRVDWLLTSLRSAWTLLRRMDDAGLLTSPTYATVLNSLGQGVRHFGEREGLITSS